MFDHSSIHSNILLHPPHILPHLQDGFRKLRHREFILERCNQYASRHKLHRCDLLDIRNMERRLVSRILRQGDKDSKSLSNFNAKGFFEFFITLEQGVKLREGRRRGK